MTEIYAALYNPVLAKLVKNVLAERGSAGLSFFDDGLNAYRRVLEKPPDLLILDLFLPSLSGSAISRLLKFQERYQTIPILIVSPSADESLVKQSRRAGADGFLGKESVRAELLPRVRALLEKRKES